VIGLLWLDVLDDTVRACGALGRADLVQRLRQKRSQLLDPKLRVLILGEPKQGKSQLANALVNASVCAVGDDITTTVPTVIQHAEAPSAALVRGPAVAVPGHPAGERVPIPIEQVATKVHSGLSQGRDHIEVGIPRSLLTSGLVLVDTPSAAARATTASATRAATSAALAQADVVLVVTDATQELSATELALLRHVVTLCPHVLVILTKIDIAPRWRDVAERNRSHLAAAGIPATLIPVSAVLRLRAARTGDRTLNAESGFPLLAGSLQRFVAAKNDLVARRTVRLLATAALDQLAAPLQAERAAQDSRQASGAIWRLHEAQRRLDDLKRRSARWQNLLADEITDLINDIEYDLRERTRTILRRVDESLDEMDPAKSWQPFGEWLEDNLVEAAEANFAWLVERLRWVAARIAREFPMYPDDVLPESAFRLPDELLDTIAGPERPAAGEFTLPQKVFAGVRGSYGGLAMFGLLTTLAGLPIINVVSIGAGVLFGGRTIRDEHHARLARRQAAAKTVVQRHVDDFFVKFGKNCKDTARYAQRRLRDHFTTVAEELQQTIVESARSAKMAVDSDATERARRDHEIGRDLERLRALYVRAKMLTAAQPATTAPELAA
jgi:hypothetical protein